MHLHGLRNLIFTKISHGKSRQKVNILCFLLTVHRVHNICNKSSGLHRRLGLQFR